MIVFNADIELDEEARRLAGNVILAQSFDEDEDTQLMPWAQAIVAGVGGGRGLTEMARTANVPVLAVGREVMTSGGAIESLAELRRGCDRLQRDLAKQGDFAGYLIWQST